MQEQTQDITSILADLHNRVRSLEGKYNLMGERLLMVNQNMIEEYKKSRKEVNFINSDIIEMKRELETLREATRNIVKELDSFAKKSNVKVIEKYIKLLSPLKFVTEEQLRQALAKEKESHG